MTAALLLIVDDDERCLRLAHDVLAHAGHTVLACASAEEAQARLRTLRPDLMLLDIQLPGLSGFELLAWMQTQPDLDGVPMIALTASVMPAERRQLDAAGFSAYLPKPLSLKALRACVDEQLQRAAARGPT